MFWRRLCSGEPNYVIYIYSVVQIYGTPACLGPWRCLTTVTWRCRKRILADGGGSFLWKRCCHWLKGLRQRSDHCSNTGLWVPRFITSLHLTMSCYVSSCLTWIWKWRFFIIYRKRESYLGNVLICVFISGIIWTLRVDDKKGKLLTASYISSKALFYTIPM